MGRDGFRFFSSRLDNLFCHSLTDATPRLNLHCRMRSVEEREETTHEMQRGGGWKGAGQDGHLVLSHPRPAAGSPGHVCVSTQTPGLGDDHFGRDPLMNRRM